MNNQETPVFPMEYHGYTIQKCDLGRYYIADENGVPTRSWVGYGSLLLAKTNVIIDLEQRGHKVSSVAA